MIKKLRRRLAVIFTVLTGGVLTVVLVASFSQSAYQTRQNLEDSFKMTVERVVVALVLGGDAPQDQVGLAAGNAIACVMTDGKLLPPGTVVAEASTHTTYHADISIETKEALLSKARATAEEKGLAVDPNPLYTVTTGDVVVDEAADFTEPASPVENKEGTTYTYTMKRVVEPSLNVNNIFEMRVDDVPYRAVYFMMQPEDGPLYETAVLEDLGTQTQQILLDGLRYMLIWLGGLGLLFLANWALAGRVLRSTREGLRRQTEFVAAASHELRSPLAVIRASLSAAKEARQEADEPQAEKFSAAAMDEAERMGRLVDDLLLLAGGDAGSWQLDKAPVDLDTLLIDTAERYRLLAKAKGRRLKLVLPDETLPKPRGDAERLRQILVVLLDNALQYAPEDTAVSLSAKAKKGRMSISVADCGPGIPEEEKERVFDRFYRADKSRHDKAHFGLGLSVARELAGLHGGKLTVAATPGGGATFTLTLPVG